DDQLAELVGNLLVRLAHPPHRHLFGRPLDRPERRLGHFDPMSNCAFPAIETGELYGTRRSRKYSVSEEPSPSARPSPPLAPLAASSSSSVCPSAKTTPYAVPPSSIVAQAS